MSKLLRLSEEEYFAIEEAIAANARGRAFLRMRDQRTRTVSADELKRMLKSISPASNGVGAKYGPAHIQILRQELQEMSVYMQQTRAEIAALRPDDSGNNRINAAKGELDAIILATEHATSDILGAAERIHALIQKLPRTPDNQQICDEMENVATEILTACSFQDLTGQRTMKVVNTLRYLEQRVNSMIEIWGVDNLKGIPIPEQDKRPDAHLLNGPSSDGVSQDDVDSLMSGASPAPSPPAPPPAAAAPPAPAAALAAPTASVSAAPAKSEAKPAAAGAPISQNDIDALFE
jgi:hypothetical protein